MKYYYTILFTICFMSICTTGYSQAKGYYSIGNNAEKLKIKIDNKPQDRFFRAEKGYYNIGTNRMKLRGSIREDNTYYKRIHEKKKGYYSIGNNVQKLKNCRNQIHIR